MGLALAALGLRLLLVLGGSSLPRLESVPIDTTVLLFGLALLTVSGLIIGIIPAWRLARADLRTLLNESSRNTSSGVATSRVMSGLIVAEIALAIALVAGAGWLVQSFSRLRAIDPGFVADGRLVVDVRPTETFTDPARRCLQRWMTCSAASARRCPTPRSAPVDTVPLRGDPGQRNHCRTRRAKPSIRTGFAAPRSVWSRQAISRRSGIDSISGRTFTDDDRTTSSASPSSTARSFDSISRIVTRSPVGSSMVTRQVDRKFITRIVGVVDDVRFKSLAQPDESTYYLPVRAAGRVSVTAPVDCRRAIRRKSRRQPIDPFRSALHRFDPQLVVKFTTAE